MSLIPLSKLGIGKTGTIKRVEDDGVISRRLADLGFLPETLVILSRKAPIGDPLCFEVRGSQMCLRTKEASKIWVEVE